MPRYVAIIRRDSGSDFGVEFPDLPGCISAGTTLDEALAMGREALALHLRGMVEDGLAVPPPRTLREVGQIDGDDVQAVLTLEPLDGLRVEGVRAASSASVELAELVELLPEPRPTVARRLGVSESTLRGWLRSAR